MLQRYLFKSSYANTYTALHSVLISEVSHVLYANFLSAYYQKSCLTLLNEFKFDFIYIYIYLCELMQRTL